MIGRLTRLGSVPLPLVIVAVVLADCAPAASLPGTRGEPARAAVPGAQDTRTAVAAVWEAWMAAYERGDAAALAALFTEDGIYAANTGELLRGRAGIREGVQGWIERRPQVLGSLQLAPDTRQHVVVDLLRFRTAGDAAYGLSRFNIQAEPSRCLVDAGHLLAVWRRQEDGEWRVESLVVNQLREPPENACGRR
jgi:uncharacterized protein (TIGR02246 family)